MRLEAAADITGRVERVRRWEWVEFGVIAIAVILPVLLRTRLKKGRITAPLLLAVAAQATVEGFRWQLIPLHASAIVMAITDWGWLTRSVIGWRRTRRALFGIPGLAGLLVLPLSLPIPQLPRPSGPFQVGTQTFVLVDEGREEIYGRPPPPEPGLQRSDAEPEDEIEGPPRRLVVQVWYPAVPEAGAEAAVWNPDWDVVGPALADRLGFPDFFLSHLAKVSSHSYPDAPPMSGSFPVILYSHGWTGFRTIALDQMENLASEGYLVIAADHTYGSIAVRFAGEDVVYLDSEALPSETEVGSIVYDAAAQTLVEVFAEDLAFILDTLEAGEDFGNLADHIDLNLVGLIGHSAGGGAALATCLRDDRCDAVAGLDAWVTPIRDRVIAEPLTIPAIFLRSAGWQGTVNDSRLRGLVERSQSEVIWVAIDQADHNDFVMTPLFSPVADKLGLKGAIESAVIVPLLHDYLDGFFDQALMGGGGAVFKRSPPDGVMVERLRR